MASYGLKPRSPDHRTADQEATVLENTFPSPIDGQQVNMKT